MQYTKQPKSNTICAIQPHAQGDVDAHVSAAMLAAKEIIFNMICQHRVTPSMALPVIFSPSKDINRLQHCRQPHLASSISYSQRYSYAM